MRVWYRIEQLWQSLTAKPTEEALEEARKLLSPKLMALFNSMQASEQAHSLRIFKQIRKKGYNQVELLVAALLHDVGKIRHPLRVWERVVIVIGRGLFQNRVKKWGQGEPDGWRRAFVVAEKHPEWGAELAKQAGALPQTVALIRHHQESSEKLATQVNRNWHEILQRYDDLE